MTKLSVVWDWVQHFPDCERKIIIFLKRKRKQQ